MKIRAALILFVYGGTLALAAQPLKTVQVRTANGVVEGVVSADNKVRSFKGIPYAAPPVGALRWKAPQPAASWTGVRKAADYGPRCMQGPIYSDMIFRDSGPSEDCLYLNLWMPEGAQSRLPVMFWIHGGGFGAGASSEPRQDGGNLSKKGVLVVSLNYRLGVFGFFSLPELSQESDRRASGNYGLLDQVAALRWVHDNIAAFGGDPDNVTIFGESAGSFSVSALMASPLAQGLFRRAIGESGAFFGTTIPLKSRADSEAADAKFAESKLGAVSVAKLRELSAEEVLRASLDGQRLRFFPNIDGYFLPESVPAIFAAGKQAHAALLAGWNADEGSYRQFFGKEEPTAKSYAALIEKQFGDRAAAALKLYPGATDAEAKRSAQDLAGDRFIAWGTWKWMEMQNRTGGATVYRYKFEQTLPTESADAEPRAPHAGEIEYVFQALDSKKLPWRPSDGALADLMGSYWANFARTGDPNGPDLPKWPVYRADDGYQVMRLKSDPAAAPDAQRARYELLDK
jgi:para-nitrobenzyl esterase